MPKRNLSKNSNFVKSIKALRSEINRENSISESILYATRKEFIRDKFNLIMKKKELVLR